MVINMPPVYTAPGYLLQALAPLSQHNPRLQGTPPTASGFKRREFGYGREEAVKPHICAYLRTYIHITKANNKRVLCCYVYFIF